MILAAPETPRQTERNGLQRPGEDKRSDKLTRDDYRGVMPYLIVADAAAAIDFYGAAFEATERMRLAAPDGKVMHAELDLAGGVVMLADEFPEQGFKGPTHFGGSPVALIFYVEDCDAAFARATDAGAKTQEPPTDKFFGDRSCRLEDPFGHVWTLMSKNEPMTAQEMQAKMDRMMSGGEGVG